MKKNEQIVFDLFGLLDKQENNNFNIQDTTIKKDILLPSMDFSTLFSNIQSIETIDNGYSMAILGDSLFVLRQMKERTINLIFADAPYNIGKDFGNNNDKWESVKAYVDWCKQWIDECMRVLKDDGTMYFMTATQHMPYLDTYVSEKYNVLCRIVWTYDSSGVQSKKCLALFMSLYL